MRYLFFIVLSCALLILTAQSGQALSNYGSTCSVNDDCTECKEDEECLICMNACYNFYGPADSNASEQLSSDERCRKRQAKWCNAQCWDPDDTTDEDYVSTKPHCKTAF